MFFVFITSLSAVLHLSTTTEASGGFHCITNNVNNTNNKISDTSCKCDNHWKVDTLSDLLNNSNTTVMFCDSFFELEQSIEVEGKVNISLRGLEGGETIIECTQGIGLSFTSLIDITISDLTFAGCGEIFDSTSLNFTTNMSTVNFLVSIYIYNCTNVIIERVNVIDSRGTGIAIFDTDGLVNIQDSIFSNNGGNDSIIPGGGGVYMEFTFCPPGIVDNNCTHYQKKNQNSLYSFQNCTFINNNATTPDAERVSYYRAKGVQFHGLGRGGGLCIVFKGNASQNNVTINDCWFVQNGAIWGAGLWVAFHDSPQSNILSVNNALFSKNNCYLNGGGGVDIGLLFYQEPLPKYNIMTFSNCLFRENSAKYGGGIKFYSSQSQLMNLNNNITFIDCAWEENKAQYGSAVDISPHVYDTLAGGYLPTPEFRNCNFIMNYALETQESQGSTIIYQSRAKGAFLCTGLSVHFKGSTTFDRNNGTAMYMSSSSVYFKEYSTVQFINNIGFEGGAVTLLGFSVLYVMNNSTINFLHNSAESFGGAIVYVSNNKHDFSSSRSCFIQYAGNTASVEDRHINFNFLDNTAGTEGVDTGHGASIFTTTLRPCRRGCCDNNRQMNMCDTNDTEKDLGFSCIGNFNFSGNRNNEISTSGAKFNWTNDSSTPLLVPPGRDVHLPFKLLDDLDQETFGLYHVSVQRDDEIKLDPANSYISDETVRLYGNPGSVATLQLATTGFREITLSVKIKMQECPPGYIMSDTDKGTDCVCSANMATKYFGIQRCDKTIAFIGRGYWARYNDNSNESDSTLESGNCPYTYCHTDNKPLSTDYELPDQPSQEKLDMLICGSTRTGRVCGHCRDNYSTFFHSINYKCSPNKLCNLGFLLYVLSELLPVTLLFLIIILFRIQLTSGALNGFILFVQVIDVMLVDANGYILTKKQIFGFMKAYRFIYRMFNLEFFTLDELSFCIWQGATTMDVLAVKYITIVYALLLVVATIVVMKICTIKCVKLSPKGSIIHGLSAFFVICYAQCTKVTLVVLTPTTIYGKGFKKLGNAVYYQGNIPYMKGDHLRYAIPALFFLITFVAVPPILLLVYPLCYKIFALLRIEETQFIRLTCRIIPLEKIKPLFDSFQSCFKDSYRFMAGVYFLYRLAVHVPFVLADTFTKYYVILEIELVLMLTIQATNYVYKKHWHNILDILLFANLAAINAMTLHNYKRAKETGKNPSYQIEIDVLSAIQTFLIYLPFIYVVCYIITQTLLPKFGRNVESTEVKSKYDDVTDTLAMVDYREFSSSTEEDNHREDDHSEDRLTNNTDQY